ncbi:MAG: DUF697 domain-containing protein [Isosphaeraceae bacterium]
MEGPIEGISGPAPAGAPTLDVAVYGIINAGKSSLINALARRHDRPTGPIGGTTAEVAVEDWREARGEVGPYALRLIDTPGIEEVEGHHRADLATEAARHSDLVLFVTAEDITAAALEAIRELNAAGKPLMVALNKIDLLSPPEQAEILLAVRGKLAGIVAAEDVVPIAAAPIVREKQQAIDGSTIVRTVRGEPEVGPLESRMLAAIEASAPELKELAEASRMVEGALREGPIRRARRTRAERVADETAAGLAVALAVSPIPILDLLAGSGGLAVLIRRVAGVYGERPGPSAVKALSSELLRGASVSLWGSLIGVGVGGALKFVPGVGHVAGAIAQGTSAGVFGHILGRALIDYYDRGGRWGDAGLAALLDEIAARTDRKALTRGLAAKLRQSLERLRPDAPRWPFGRGRSRA